MLIIFILGACLIIGSAPLLWTIDDYFLNKKIDKES